MKRLFLIGALSVWCFGAAYGQSSNADIDTAASALEAELRTEGFSAEQANGIALTAMAFATNQMCGESYFKSIDAADFGLSIAKEQGIPERLFLDKVTHFSEQFMVAAKTNSKYVMYLCNVMKRK